MHVRWSGLNASTFCIELSAKVSSSSSYLALGLISSSTMGPGPVLACSADPPHSFPLYWNLESKSSSPVASSTVVMDTSTHRTDGTTTCYITISSMFTVVPDKSANPKVFDLNKNATYLATAAGSVSKGVLGQVFA